MLNKFCKKPLYEITRTMANVAMGVEKAELVIRNAKLVNVCTAEIQEGIDVAIAEGRIALVVLAANHGFRYIFVGLLLLGICAEGGLLGGFCLTAPLQIYHGIQQVTVTCPECIPRLFVAYIRTLS